MGLFDNKKRKGGGDDFDSPVEQIDLHADAKPTPETAAAAEPEQEPEPKRELEQEPPQPRRKAPKSSYSIDDAIALMRTLPADNVELVVRVVKHTLESTNIEIKSIIADASDKQQRIESRVKVLKDEISDLEQEIHTRKQEIDALEADHEETTTVKDRLQLAEKLDQPGDSSSIPARTTGASSGPFGKPAEPGRRSRSPSTAPPPPPKSTSTSSDSARHTIVPKK